MSTLYSDGYNDFMAGNEMSPPDVPVFASEYIDGWFDAEMECDDIERKAEKYYFEHYGYAL